MIKPYQFQEEAIERAWDRTGFLLADDMGLGKTVTTLAEIVRREEVRVSNHTKVLVVCPKSTFNTWERHILRFDRKPIMGLPLTTTSLPQGGYVVTNWDQLRVNPAYKRVHWTYVVADEAHNAKNRKAKRTRALWTIPAMYKRALTGTPIINRPDEIWAILHWLYPEQFRSYWKFFEQYVDYEKHPYHQYRVIKGAKNVDELKEVLAPLMIRRTKKQVLTQLPDRYYETITVELSIAQRRIYTQMEKDALAWVGKHEDKPLPAKMVVAQLMRLQQICIGTPDIEYIEGELPKVTIHEPSVKLDALMDIVEGTDKQIVVFTNFRSGVHMVMDRCEKAGIKAVKLYGGMSDVERSVALDTFISGQARIFVATIATGGEGIDGLQVADMCVFLDRNWSPAKNDQAESRLHRDGQKNAVQVIDIEAAHTVDQVKRAKLIWKWSFIKKILGG